MSREPAGFVARLLAGVVDWVAALGVPFLVAGALASPLWPVIVATAIVVYFSVSLRLGGTPGMRALRIRVEGPRGRPGVVRALGRAFFSLLQGLVFIGLFALLFADVEPAPEVAGTLGLLAVAGLGASCWMLWDPERRTLLDRLFGLRALQRDGPSAAPRR